MIRKFDLGVQFLADTFVGAEPASTASSGWMTGVIFVLLWAVLLVITLWFSRADIAFSRMTLQRVEAMAAVEESAEEGSRNHKQVQRLLEFVQPQRGPKIVVTSSIVRTFLLIASICLATLIFKGVFNLDATLGFVATTAVLLIVEGYVRARAITHSEKVALSTSRLVGMLDGIAKLVFWPKSWQQRQSAEESGEVDEDALDEQHLLAIVEAASNIDHVEEARIKGVVSLDDCLVGEIMTPRTGLEVVTSGTSVDQAIVLASKRGLSRLPVVAQENQIDSVIGIMHIKDLLRAKLRGHGERPVDINMRTAMVVPENQRVSELLDDMRANRFHLVVVVDEYGGVAGVVSLEDILEEIVGEITDEHDQRELAITRLDDGSYRVDGRLELNRLERELDLDETERDYRTVAGCIFTNLGREPEVGDAIEIETMRLEVLKMIGYRIHQVRIELLEPAIETNLDVSNGQD